MDNLATKSLSTASEPEFSFFEDMLAAVDVESVAAGMVMRNENRIPRVLIRKISEWDGSLASR